MHLLTAFHEPQRGTQSLLLLFFILGGYVSARKPLSLMQSTNHESRAILLRTLSTSAFRRGLRLYLPAFAATFTTAIAAYCGLFEIIRPYTHRDVRKIYFPGSYPPTPVPRFATFYEQIRYWAIDASKMLNIWSTQHYVPTHNSFLWTLRLELWSSIHLYVTILACVRLRPWATFSVFLILSQYHMLCGRRYEVMLFFWGAAIAQGELLLEESPKTPNEHAIPGRLRRITRQIAMSPIIAIPAAYISLVLLFYPPPQLDQRAYTARFLVIRLLERVTPSTYPEKDKLYDGLGVTILIIGLVLSSPTSIGRRILTHPYVQRLGQMFFGTILVQSIILNGGGYLIPHVFWAWLDSAAAPSSMTTGLVKFILATEERQKTAGLVVGCLLNVPTAVYLGHVFVKTVVKRCMMLVLLIEALVCNPEDIDQDGRLAAETKVASKEM